MRGRPVEMLAALASLLILLVFAASATADEGFGIESLTNRLESAGAPARQAGSHPDSMTTTIVFNHHKSSALAGTGFAPDGNPRWLEVNLPPGLLVNPTATLERCTEEELVTTGKHIEGQAECPPGAAVGEILAFTEIGALPATVYNMVPPPGVPADFGFNLLGLTVVHLEGRVQAGGGYHISAYAPEIIQRDGVYSATVTLNGFPNGATGKPLLRMPTSCGGTLTVAAEAESWQGEHAFLSFAPFDGEGHTLTVTGCGRLGFRPELRVLPSTRMADAPSGLSVELSVPQEGADGLAQADLKEAVIALPPGFTVSPASAAGLGACSPAQIKLSTQERPECPPSSRVGSVEIVTPLLGPERPLHGSIYLAQQGENPFHDLLALYLVAEVANVVLKVPGEVTLDATTGQITTRFGQDPVNGDYLPQLPFSHLRVDLFGGSRAPLSTPHQCGTYTVTSRLTPWSAPESGPPATPGASFAIDEGCHPPAFAPTLLAGTESNRAGAFSPFLTTLRREDGEGEFGRIQVKLPPGLLANIASVALCGEPQAELGECPAASRIGHVTTGVGPGPDPLYVSGEVFLTGPYNGAPYGLTIEVPAIAGPFDLDLEGRPVVVRAAISVDRHTATATVTTDPLPQIIQGVPLQVRVANVTIDRPGFTFNPTSCAPMAIAGEATSTLGQSAPLTSRFQAADCASLAFKPKFTVSTSGHTSRKNGASLDAKLSYPADRSQIGQQGREANIAVVKVSLPKQLPSRLTTLHKACVAATFEANPAACPPASAVGVVKVSTPVLPVTLTGPVYFVSHGGEAFPSLVIMLQGDGVRVDLTAATFISKAGVTSSTFKTVPDVPFNAFELYLPPGQYSALAANGNLCRAKLAMPTAFVAQNGAEIHQSTPIAVRGCPVRTYLRPAGAGRTHGSGSAARRRSR
ncbi:MAG: hypothetical protein ACHQE6_03170 [Solirubrobacterales bacterium]